MRSVALVAALASLVVLAGCDECAGTPSCRGTVEVSYGGQFIERESGAPVAGVLVRFARGSGARLVADTVRAISDGDGHFQLRGAALQAGIVTGALLITPPAPFAPFTIPDVALATNSVRGAGHNFGRLVVDPYLLLIGHVRDRETHTPLPGATVTMRRISGGRAERDTMPFTTDFGGQFSWEPEILDPAPILAEFEIAAPGYPRTFVVQRELVLRYRDNEMTFVILPVGWGLAYSGVSARRGSFENVAGAMLEIARISGIQTQPSQVTIPLDANAAFMFPLEPQGEGPLVAEIRVLPPARFPSETTRVELRTSDDDIVQFLGAFHYGAQVHLLAELRDADTGETLESGTLVVMKRTSGLSLDWTVPTPDGDFRKLSSGGRLVYHAPTPDSGSVVFDMIVRLPPPFAWDTIRNVSVPAWYSDSAHDAGAIAVRRRPKP